MQWIILHLGGFLCARDTGYRCSKITDLQSLILNLHHFSIVIIWAFSDCLRFQGVVSQLSSLFCWWWQLCIRVCYMYGTSEITLEWQNHIFLSNKYVSQALYQTILNVIKSKTKLWITVVCQVFKNHYSSLLDFFPSLAPFVLKYFTLLFLPSFKVLTFCFTQFGRRSNCLKFV